MFTMNFQRVTHVLMRENSVRDDFKTQPPVDCRFRPVLGGFYCSKQWQPLRTGRNRRSTGGWVLKSPLMLWPVLWTCIGVSGIQLCRHPLLKIFYVHPIWYHLKYEQNKSFHLLCSVYYYTHQETQILLNCVVYLLQKLNLDQYLLYAHGPDLCRGSDLRHAMANCFEAVMAAVYLEAGLDEVKRLFCEVMFDGEEEMQRIWTNHPPHPLQVWIKWWGELGEAGKGLSSWRLEDLTWGGI